MTRVAFVFRDDSAFGGVGSVCVERTADRDEALKRLSEDPTIPSYVLEAAKRTRRHPAHYQEMQDVLWFHDDWVASGCYREDFQKAHAVSTG